MKFSFIHIADIHLGRAFSSLSEYAFDNNAKQIYKNAVEISFNNFINYAVEQKVDFILISGDTFDNSENDFKSKLILKEGLKKLDAAGIKVFLICGNHDPVSVYNKTTFNFDENSNIKIIGVNTPKYGIFKVENYNNEQIAEIHAYSYAENHINENPLNFFTPSKTAENKTFNIGLLHCDLDADKKSPYIPVLTGELLSFNYDYWALGHIHIPSDENNIGYAGTIQGRNTKETGAHGFKHIIVENNKIVSNSLIAADTVRFQNININLSNTVDITSAYEVIQEKITEFIRQEKTENCKLFLLKLILEGNISFYPEITQDFCKTLADRTKEIFNNRIYISDIMNNTQPEIESEILCADDGIAGEIYRITVDENINDALNKAQADFKNLITQCNFSEEELIAFKKKITKSVKDKCLTLANRVYYNEDRTDV